MKISVVMCTYNGEKFVAEQLLSIINQTRPVDEIIISDDNSVDRTIDIVKMILKDITIPFKIIQNNPGKGVADNFLGAMKMASGDYIFTSDQDDIWKKDKVAVFCDKILQDHKMLYFSDGELIDAKGEVLGVSLWSTLNNSYELLSSTDIRELLLKKCVVTGSAMVVSHILIDKIDRIPEGWLHDGWIAMAAAMNNSVVPINDKTYYYRQHDNNVVGAHKLTFQGRVLTWISNINEQNEIRNARYNRYLAVKKYYLGENQKQLDECIGFWHDLKQIDEIGKLEAIKLILRNLGNKNYYKYYTGLKGALRDFITIFKN